jgi:predicted NBD/HSP70 family sugar kinase
VAEPRNLAAGWVGFDFPKAFGSPIKLINDAAMQELGSYCGGKMLFLGLGTGLGTTLIVDGIVEPMELAYFPYRKANCEDYVKRTYINRKNEWGEGASYATRNDRTWSDGGEHRAQASQTRPPMRGI